MYSGKMSFEILSISEFFSLGWSIFKQNMLTILYLVLSIQLVVEMFDYLLEDIGGIISTPIFVLLPMGIAYIVEMQLKDDSVSINDVYARLFSVWITGYFTHLLSILIIFGMSLLLFIPGLVWSIYYVFVMYVVVLRGEKWKKALDYSKSLVKGRWWTVFGYTIVFGLIVIPFAIINFLAMQRMLIFVTSKAISNVVVAYSTVLSVLLFLNLDSIKKAREARLAEAVPDVIPQFIRPEILSK